MQLQWLFLLNWKTEEFLLNKLNALKSQGVENLVILADFDKTFTVWNSYTSWSLLARSWLVDENYAIERDKYYEINRPIEIDWNLDFEFRKENTKNWWLAHLNLILKYKITRDQIDKVAFDNMKFREWSIDFINLLNDLNIPLIIVSAWIWNFIEEFLRTNNVLHKNISIEANFLTFDESWVVSGVDKDHIIHTLNKDNHVLKESSRSLIGNRTNGLIMWDNIEDIRIKNLVKLENYFWIWLLASDSKPEDFENTQFDCVNMQSDFWPITNIFKYII